jgi:putative heme-binding domain-containing protein
MLRRPETIEVLLKAIASDQIRASELSADMVQQIRRFDSAALNQQVESLWGNVRELSKDKEKAMEQTKKMIEDPSPGTDLGKGQMLFAKSCGQCHVLFGEGGKIGPELTGSNRKDLKYLLENILDPSAVMAKEYRPLIVQTTDGQTITGLLRSSNKDSLRIQTATEEVVLYSDDIAQKKQSEVSMMPSDLLSPLKEDEVRDLMAYIRSR